MTYSPNRSEGKSSRHWGIGVNVHDLPVHTQPYDQAMGFAEGDFPQAERYYREAISLPLYPGLTDRTQQVVVEAVQWVIGGFPQV